jgi:hypothetical protein
MTPIETQLETVVARLFDEMPALVGFSIESLEAAPEHPVETQLERELVLSNVETFPWTGYSRELLGEIAVPLLELIDEEPQARELLRGRTFARRMH